MRNLAGAIALLLTAAGLIRTDGAFLAAALPFAAFALMAVLLPGPAPRLAADRCLSERLVPAGNRVAMTVTVTNLGSRLEALRLADEVPEGVRVVEGTAYWRGSLNPGATAILHYSLECPRGSYRFGNLAVTAEDPLTGVVAQRALPCPERLDVHPQRLFTAATRLGAGSPRPFPGLSRSPRTGGGVDFAGVREYAAGDPLRRLNWRASAFWARPLVNLYEETRAIEAGIILDCRAKAYGDGESFESAAAAALAWAENLLDQGHRVAFLMYGDLLNWMPPGTGRDQRTRMRMTAARAQLGAHMAFEGFDHLPVQIFPPRSMILLVSPLLRQDVAPLRKLRALGYTVAVLRPDPPPQAGNSKDPAQSLARRLCGLEMEVLASSLLRAGITFLDGQPGLTLAAGQAPQGARG
jgi:uncharacterized protein (DUF58 family)